MDPLSFGRLWPETAALVRRHAQLLWPVAAAFLFFPQLLVARQLGSRTPDQLFQPPDVLGDSAALAFLVVASLIGQLVIARIAAADGTGGVTLGGHLKRAVGLFPAALAVSLVLGLGAGFGLFLFVIPGLWLFSRLCLVVPLVATQSPDPIAAIQHSWRLTSGHAFRIFGLLAVLILGFLLLTIGIGGLGAAVGVVTTVATGQPAEGWGVGRWLFALLDSAASAAMGTYYIVFLTRLAATLAAQGRIAG